MTERVLEYLDRLFFTACGMILGLSTWYWHSPDHIAVVVNAAVFFLTSARIRQRLSRRGLLDTLGSRNPNEHLNRATRRAVALPLFLVLGDALTYIFDSNLAFRVGEVSAPVGTWALLTLQVGGLSGRWWWRASSRLSPIATTPITDALTWLTRLILLAWSLIVEQQAVLVGFAAIPIGIGLAAVLRLAITDRQQPTSKGPVGSLPWLYVSFTKGWLLTCAICERQLSALAIGISVPLFGYYFGIAAERTGPTAVALLVSGGSFWLVPVVRDLIALDDTLHWAYMHRMRQITRSLRHHILVLGMGDLGRRLIRTLFTSDVLDYATFEDNRLFSTNILLPNGHLAKVLTRISAIEISESRVSGVARSATGSGLGWLDVNAATLQGRTGNLVDYIVPVIVGDAMNADTRNSAGIERARFVASLLPDTKDELRSQSIVNTLHSIARRSAAVPAVVALHSSTYIPYVTEKRLRYSLPLHYIYPAHLEGLNAGTLTYAAFVGATIPMVGGTDAVHPRVMFCGSGKRVTYLLDSLLKCFSATELRRLHSNRHVNGGPIFSLLSADDELDLLAVTDPHPTEAAYWQSVPERLAITTLTISRFVTRSSALTGDVDGHLRLTRINGDPADYLTSQAVLQHLRPDIIVVSHPNADESFRAINALGTVITRLGLTPPLLLVSGETGRLHFVDYFDRALRYYASTLSPQSRPWRYPLPWMPPLATDAFGHALNGGLELGERQPLIDVLDDPIERLIGLVRSYVSPEERAAPVEISFCAPDRPGMLATTLAGLAGFRPRSDARSPGVSVANTRLIARARDGFVVKGYGYLNAAFSDRPALTGAGFQRAAIVAGHEPQSDHPASIRAALIDRTTDSCGVMNLVDSSPDTYAQQLAHCCGMPTCPIEGFNKVGLAVAHASKSDANGSSRSLERLQQRFVIASTFSRKLPTDRDDRPFAYFTLSCTGESLTGSCAAAICSFLQIPLLLLDEGPQRTINTQEGDDRIFTVMYMSSYECHDEGHGVFTIYGQRVPRDNKLNERVKALSIDNVLRVVEIWPVREAHSIAAPNPYISWEQYADELVAFLNNESAPGTFHRRTGSGGSIVVSHKGADTGTQEGSRVN